METPRARDLEPVWARMWARLKQLHREGGFVERGTALVPRIELDDGTV